MSHTKEDLKELQSKSLEEKIQISTARIIEWYEHWDGKVAISFSGGKDSTVLLDLVRNIYPDVPAIFCDTGLEFPEIRDFVKSITNVEILKPKKSFVQVLSEVGYPLGSKRTSLNIEYGRKARERNDEAKFNEYCNGVRHGKDGTNYVYMPICKQLRPLIDAPVRISNKCCDIMKKKPIHEYCKRTGRKTINGTMATESKQRELGWIKTGCNVFSIGREVSHPMSFWTEQDVLLYIKRYHLPYASVYGDLIELQNGQLEFTGRQRTGCVFCGFGCHLEKEPNRFQTLAKTHPQLYDYCMRGGKYDDSGMWIPDKGLGMAKVLDYINVKWWNDGDEAKRDEYRAKYKEKEEIEQSRKKSSQTD